MHPVVVLLLLALLCTVGPYALGLTAAVGACVAFCVGMAEFATAAFAGFTPHGPIGHLRIAPPQPSDTGPDPAYRSYYAGPVLLDYRKVLAQTYRRMWARVVRDEADDPVVRPAPPMVERVWDWREDTVLPGLLAVPAAVAAVAGLVGGALAAAALVAFTSLVFLALLVVLVTGALLTAGGARLLEFGVLFLRGITLECPACHERVTRPIYRCDAPGCGAAHRKLVPGTAGVLRRTCRCHRVLPTLLALGKNRLSAQCGACRHELPEKGLSAPTVHITVVAGPKAGKSVFMHSAVSRLRLRDEGFEFADPRAKESFERNVELGVHLDPSRALKTATVKPRAYNVFVGRGRARRLLYLYDPAGEHVASVDHLADAQFLAFTKGVVFIVDPFSLRQVRADTDRAVLGRVSASHTAPKEVLERFVEALVERGSARRDNRIGIPVALVLTKCDGLLDPAGAAHPCAGLGAAPRAERDRAIRSWLTANGQHDVLSSLDNHFAAVSCFAVSYRDAVEVGGQHDTVNDDPAAPLRWLLDRKEEG
ncbi:TRAFAC clade GTPase domain-containing protein [Saccharothrix australiensis]|uniref:Double-GTPase 2 domain-containing protein n=1 Tax=Saccharothrix australiensis TaxID=2072 RepID=A0A495VWB8_9PSEU|nr:hypothetical protein [Saccharothrix australiensis]RKT52843.1 hypothetical protein C8E97_1381 [Saccharothrix australiensis]